MRRWVWGVSLLLLLGIATPASATEVAGVPLPKGSRADGCRHVSGKGYRDTVDFVARWLDRQGLAHRVVGPYRARGVDVTRFLSEDASTAWLAVHVLRQGGKTWISVVKRPS